MNIYLYPNVSKFSNSTKLPDTTAKQYSGSLIEPCSIIAPSISFVADGTTEYSKYNYANIPQFGRYYYITDWVYNAGRWVATMKVDVLASYRNQIGATSQYVLRSSAECDQNIIDTMYPTLCGSTMSSCAVNSIWERDYSNGWFVVGIINSDSDALGAVSYYAFNDLAFRALKNYLLGDSNWWGSIDEISEELFKALVNPFQYIVSCMWLPYAPPGNGKANANTNVGWWKIPVASSGLSNNTITSKIVNIPIPKHPQTNIRGKWVNMSPTTRLWLDFRPFGTIPLDTTAFYNSDSVNVLIHIDYVTGSGSMTIHNDDGEQCGVYYAQIGVPVQLSQMSNNILGGAMNMLTSVAGGIVGGVTGSVAGIVGSAGNMVNSATAFLPQVSTTGTNGTLEAFFHDHQVIAQFTSLADENVSKEGRPLCKNKKISDIPGYIVCATGDCKIPATMDESKEITNHLLSGFYYE